MNSEDCLSFARTHPVCQLATVEGDQPHVRTVLLWHADTTGFYIILLSPKKVSSQLKANPKAELCFYNQHRDISHGRQLRVTGRMELVTDPELNARAVRDRRFLSSIAGRPVDSLVEVFRMTAGDAHFWSMRDVLKEPTLEHVTV